jgi:hypothetical protein
LRAFVGVDAGVGDGVGVGVTVAVAVGVGVGVGDPEETTVVDAVAELLESEGS